MHKAEAQVLGAERMLDEARASVDQRKAQATLTHQELERAVFLFQKGYGTAQTLDLRRQEDAVAAGALAVADARVGEAEQTLAAATHDVSLYRINIADNSLVAPRDGRIQYRLANVGEVLAAGGKVFTMLDTGYVYIDIFLPTADAGRIVVGADARIVLDALPDDADAGQGGLHLGRGPVHAEGGRDQDRAGQAHVPRAGPRRSRRSCAPTSRRCARACPASPMSASTRASRGPPTSRRPGQ